MQVTWWKMVIGCGFYHQYTCLLGEKIVIIVVKSIFRWEIDDNLCSRARIGVIFDMVGPYYSYAGNLMEDGHRKRVLSSIYMWFGWKIVIIVFKSIFRCEIDDNLCSRARIGVIFDMVGPYKSPGNYWYGDGHRKHNQRRILKKTGSRSVCALEWHATVWP